jgi:hypothetical protein
MRQLRAQRGNELASEVSANRQQLKDWAEAQVDAINARRARLQTDSRVYHAQKGRLDHREQRVHALVEAQDRWFERSVTTADTPVLHLALAVAGPEVTQ